MSGPAVTIPMNAEDVQLLEQLMEGSPFKRDVLLSVALRIGLQTIQKDPTSLMPFVSRMAPDDDD